MISFLLWKSEKSIVCTRIFIFFNAVYSGVIKGVTRIHDDAFPEYVSFFNELIDSFDFSQLSFDPLILLMYRLCKLYLLIKLCLYDILFLLNKLQPFLILLV